MTHAHITLTAETQARIARADRIREMLAKYTVPRNTHADEPQVLNIITREAYGRAVLHYYTLAPRSRYTDRHYHTHDTHTLYTTSTITIRPRKFHTVAQIEHFLTDLQARAHREIEEAEQTLLLRYITTGHTYTLTTLIPHTLAPAQTVLTRPTDAPHASAP